MILIGIVGALSPLGKNVAEELKSLMPDYKVIWTVDEGYKCDNKQKSQFRDLETVLLYGLNPSLVLDFGSSKDVLKRAMVYRKYNLPAIIQGVLSADDIEFLNNYYKDDYIGKRAPLMVEPEFSTVKTHLVKNLLSQANYFLKNIQSIEINIRHHAEIVDVTLPWYYWMRMLDNVLKEEMQMVSAHVPVKLNDIFEEDIAQDEEVLDIKLTLPDGGGALEWKLSCPLLDSRTEGVFLMMEWYMIERENTFDLMLGNVTFDIMPMLI